MVALGVASAPDQAVVSRAAGLNTLSPWVSAASRKGRLDGV